MRKKPPRELPKHQVARHSSAHQPFARAEKNFLAICILISLPSDTLRRVLQRQQRDIRGAGSLTLSTLLESLSLNHQPYKFVPQRNYGTCSRIRAYVPQGRKGLLLSS